MLVGGGGSKDCRLMVEQNFSQLGRKFFIEQKIAESEEIELSKFKKSPTK